MWPPHRGLCCLPSREALLFSRRSGLKSSATRLYFTKTHTHANCFGTISSHVPSNVPRAPETIRREGPISTIRSELQTESSLRRKKETPESGQKGKLLPDTVVFLGPRANPAGQPHGPTPPAVTGTRSSHTSARGGADRHTLQESHPEKDKSQTLKQPGTGTPNCCVCTERALGSDAGLESCRLGDTATGGHGLTPSSGADARARSLPGTLPLRGTAILQRGSFRGDSPSPSVYFVQNAALSTTVQKVHSVTATHTHLQFKRSQSISERIWDELDWKGMAVNGRAV